MGDHFVDAVVGVIAIVTLFGAPVAGWVIVRSLAHRERMEMIRNGMVPPAGRQGRNWNSAPPQAPEYRAPDPSANRYGQRGDRCKEPLPPAVALRKGIGLTMTGIALTIGLSFVGYHDGSISPGPWLLGGLIPMFVGLAQVLTAILSGATFTAPTYTPPPNYGPPGPPTYDSSYTYRPGDTQELRPPGPLDPRTRP